MSYEFYLDIYFLENLVINDTVLRMIAILEKKNCPRIRRFLTAAGGSLALCLGMMLGMYRVRVLTAIVCMAVETLMTTAAFSWSGWKTFMYRAVIFRLLSLLAEGSWQILRDYFHMPFPYSMAAGILLPFLVLLKVRTREQKEQFLYPVTVVFRGRQKQLTALWDSGNQLRQPLTGRPVHIIELEAVQPLLEEEERRELMLLLELKASECPSGIFSFVPYQSIGKKHGILPVLKLDEIRVEKENETVDTPEVLAAVSKDAVSRTGAYQMILHP